MTAGYGDKPWGLVYTEPKGQDELLEGRWSEEDVAVRIAIEIVRQFIATSQEPYLVRSKSQNNVVSVRSQRTGRTYFSLRPVIAQRFLENGGKRAPDSLSVALTSLLSEDDTDWTE
jgi:hypothetical protein